MERFDIWYFHVNVSAVQIYTILNIFQLNITLFGILIARINVDSGSEYKF